MLNIKTGVCVDYSFLSSFDFGIKLLRMIGSHKKIPIGIFFDKRKICYRNKQKFFRHENIPI